MHALTVAESSRKARRNNHVDLKELRAQVSEALNTLSSRLIGGIDDQPADAATKRLQARVAKLGQIAAGLAVVDPEVLPAEGAGFGSTVTLKNVATGEREEYTLMLGTLVDIEANQVSLASPIGQALLGRNAGEEITITTPHRVVTMLITSVTTLMDDLEVDDAHAPAH